MGARFPSLFCPKEPSCVMVKKEREMGGRNNKGEEKQSFQMKHKFVANSWKNI
jgi:hypothetical protein